MHSTNIRSTALSLEIRDKNYIIKHVNSVLDTKQFDKKTHALSSSTVNVVCAKVTATTTTTQDMWDRMNIVSKRRSIDAYDRTYTDENNHPYRHDTSEEEEEEEEEEEDQVDARHHRSQDDYQEESDLDITGSDNESVESVQQTQTVKSNSNLFQFHFEFGSKRPPRATIQQDVQEDSDEQEATDVDEEEPHSFLSSEQQDSDSERSLFDSASSSNDEDDDDEDEDGWNSKHVMADSKYFPSATDEALQTFENIENNIYIGSATGRSMAEESMPCECKYDSELENPNEACGDDNICINRMMFMECIVQDCPCGRLCRNRRFQLGQYSPVDVIKTEKKGFGLRALTNLPQNSFIMEYIGEVIPQSEFLRRTREYDAEGFKHYYFMTLKNDEIIDATKRGCLARFMNHSCNPNCVTQKWVIGKKMRIGIFTSRAITAGEELTFDYKFERYGAMAQRCYCGEPNCKGFIGASEEKAAALSATAAKDEDVLMDTHLAPDASLSTSSSDDDDDEFSDQDKDEDEIMMQKTREPQPLQDPHKVQSFVKRMLNSVGKPRLVNKLLMRLQMTNVDNSHGREILKMIVRLHGLKMLKFWLGEWKNNEMIVLRVLQVLERLPLANRNGLEDCKLFDIVHKFVDHDNEEISRLSQHLLDEWSELKCVYRIPKRAHVDMSVTTAEEEEEDDDDDDEGGDFMEESVEQEEEEEEGEGTETLDMDSQQQTDTSSITVPAKKSAKRHNQRKKLKRKRFESTREFFDPDNDLYEYFSMDATPQDLAFRLQYPPPSSIPTAPKAMLESNNNNNNNTVYHHQKHYNHTNKLKKTNGGGFFSYHSTNNINHQISSSTPITINNTTCTPNSTITTTDDTLLQQQQQQSYTDYYQNPSSMYDYSQFYYAQAAAAEGMTVEEYYYAFQQQQQQQQAAMPATNWQLAVTEDGSTYYYNMATHQTQWEIPQELEQLQSQVPPPPPPPPVQQPPPPPSSSSSSSLPSNLPHSTSSNTSLQKAGLSIEGVVDPLQLEGLVEQAILESDEKKRLMQLNLGEDSPNSKGSHLLTPTSGSVDAAMNEEGPWLNDIDLKREVGKVVTKYLSSKQQALWKGDKHLFKDLARKVTHHIVDREMQSGRKIKAMDTGLRIKIEKFIDAYGTDYVSKFKQKNLVGLSSSSSSPSMNIN